MQCINPLKAGYNKFTGEREYNQRSHISGLDPDTFPCRKCLPCRLNQAREKAIRCYHEAKMHKESIFLTLTYSDEHLKSPRLIYADFQKFMMDLLERRYRDVTDPEIRKTLFIPFMVTGEYGDKTKRPHWHALLFNFRPRDEKALRTTDRGDRIFTSEALQSLWGKGIIEYGEITLESASYVARYAAKKLAHGSDQEHEFHPIHKTSSKHAIGKRWIERYWKHTFRNGFVVLPNGARSKIPRYYVDWLKKHNPDEWRRYVTETRLKNQELAAEKSRKQELTYMSDVWTAYATNQPRPISLTKMELTVLNSKFRKLQEKLKL